MESLIKYNDACTLYFLAFNNPRQLAWMSYRNVKEIIITIAVFIIIIIIVVIVTFIDGTYFNKLVKHPSESFMSLWVYVISFLCVENCIVCSY